MNYSKQFQKKNTKNINIIKIEITKKVVIAA